MLKPLVESKLMGVAAKPLTWDDIKDWPEDAGYRTELVHGELVVSPSPTSPHQRCVALLTIRLGSAALESNWGEVISGPMDVVLASGVVFQPDLLFVRAERSQIIEHTHIAGPPDICVEIISEGNRTHDTVVKFQDYARYGVPEYWLVDLREREISTWRNANRSYELIGRASAGEKVQSLVLPELELDPAQALPSEPPSSSGRS